MTQCRGAGPDLDWGAGDVPVSTRFDDPYFSLQDGPGETRHVFLAGNGLPARFRDGFRVAELGFGTGLNLLVTLASWRAAGVRGVLHYTAFEAWPMRGTDLRRAQAAFAGLAHLAAELQTAWGGAPCDLHLPDLRFALIVGDARQTLPRWQGCADAWYLDGFAPAKNPELWQPDLLGQVGAHSAPGGSAATYSAAGTVRRGLAAAGFLVERVPGHGRKRHMTRARMPA